MPELIPRVVFDCNLFVQGIANRNSPARKALRLFFNGDISLFVSEPMIREVRDVPRARQVRHFYRAVRPSRSFTTTTGPISGSLARRQKGGVIIKQSDVKDVSLIADDDYKCRSQNSAILCYRCGEWLRGCWFSIPVTFALCDRHCRRTKRK